MKCVEFYEKTGVAYFKDEKNNTRFWIIVNKCKGLDIAETILLILDYVLDSKLERMENVTSYYGVSVLNWNYFT